MGMPDFFKDETRRTFGCIGKEDCDREVNTLEHLVKVSHIDLDRDDMIGRKIMRNQLSLNTRSLKVNVARNGLNSPSWGIFRIGVLVSNLYSIIP